MTKKNKDKYKHYWTVDLLNLKIYRRNCLAAYYELNKKYAPRDMFFKRKDAVEYFIKNIYQELIHNNHRK